MEAALCPSLGTTQLRMLMMCCESWSVSRREKGLKAGRGASYNYGFLGPFRPFNLSADVFC